MKKDEGVNAGKTQSRGASLSLGMHALGKHRGSAMCDRRRGHMNK